MRCFKSWSNFSLPSSFCFTADGIDDTDTGDNTGTGRWRNFLFKSDWLKQILIIVSRKSCTFVFLDKCAFSASLTTATDFKRIRNFLNNSDTALVFTWAWVCSVQTLGDINLSASAMRIL